jgi:hypothetical protein
MRRALLTALLAAGACSGTTPGNGGSICTLIGCTDELTATLHDATGGLPSGKQVLTVMENGMTLTCSFTLPRPAQGGGITCPQGLTVTVVQAQTCVTSGDGTYQTQVCTPVAGKFNEVVAIVGSPTTLHVTQTVDGASYLDQTTTPTYTTTRPNGPNCEPVCSQASMEWVLAPQ